MSLEDVVVIGGGIVGLATALELRRDGFSVAVVDRFDMGRGASWAGAGMIAPTAERPSNPLERLRDLSARLYPHWAIELKDQTGVDIGYRRCGGIDLALEPSETIELDRQALAWQNEGIAYELIDPDELGRIEPNLTGAFVAAYSLPDRGQIRNPRLLHALEVANRSAGVSLMPGVEAISIEIHGDRVISVKTKSEEIFSGIVVVAAGARTGEIVETAGVRLETPPIKGQIVLLKTEPGVLKRVVEHGKNYLVPREDGRILVGATEENAGFDVRPTAAAVAGLIAEAERLCPSLAQAEVERAWGGSRPGNRDGRPYIGRAPGLTNLFVAAGHFRAGIQLAPATAALIAALIKGGETPVDASYFALDRPRSTAQPAAIRS